MVRRISANSHPIRNSLFFLIDTCHTATESEEYLGDHSTVCKGVTTKSSLVGLICYKAKGRPGKEFGCAGKCGPKTIAF